MQGNIFAQECGESNICFSFPFLSFFLASYTHIPYPSGQISLSVIDLCWVTLLFPIRPIFSLMTWKWVDELPALISLQHITDSGLAFCNGAHLGLTGTVPTLSHYNLGYNYLCMTLTSDKLVFLPVKATNWAS